MFRTKEPTPEELTGARQFHLEQLRHGIDETGMTDIFDRIDGKPFFTKQAQEDMAIKKDEDIDILINVHYEANPFPSKLENTNFFNPFQLYKIIIKGNGLTFGAQDRYTVLPMGSVLYGYLPYGINLHGKTVRNLIDYEGLS